jgi:hypothetical protein
MREGERSTRCRGRCPERWWLLLSQQPRRGGIRGGGGSIGVTIGGSSFIISRVYRGGVVEESNFIGLTSTVKYASKKGA